MKKTALILSLASLSFSSIFISCDKDTDNEIIIPYTALPENAKNFISEHFPNTPATKVEKDNPVDINDRSVYEVMLSNGFEISFDENGNWTDIDGKNTRIPASILALIPNKITQYINNNFSNLYIIEISIKHYGYEVELNTGKDLIFDFEGNLK